MGKRHYTPQELCMMAKRTAQNKEISSRSPFTVFSVYSMWNLWKTEGWGAVRLQRYLEIHREWYSLFDDDLEDDEQYSLQLIRIQEKIKDKDFEFGYVKYTEADMPKDVKEGTFLYNLQMKQLENNNLLNKMSTKYLLAHFNALIDLGFGRIKIRRNRDQMDTLLENAYLYDENKCLEIRKELVDKLGICIEMPIVKGRC